MATELFRSYRLSIEAVTPLHVGGGEGRLVRDVDFIADRGQIYLIDPERVWQRIGEEQLRHWNASDFRLSELISPSDYAACARLIVPIQGHVEFGSGLLSHIHDVNGWPYLPGSSLKGALRSALLRAVDGPIDVAQIGHQRNKAGEMIEGSVWGKTPNTSMLRTLRIGDSQPVEPSTLRAVVVAVYSLRGSRLEPKGQGYRWSVLALPAGTRLEARLSIDQYTQAQTRFSTWPKALLDELPKRVRQAANELIASERAFFSEVELHAVSRFYDRLAGQAATDQESFYLPIGWGTGWLAKTLGPALRDTAGFAEIRTRFGLGRDGAPFPKSRRLVETAPDQPAEPVGWAKLTLRTEAK